MKSPPQPLLSILQGTAAHAGRSVLGDWPSYCPCLAGAYCFTVVYILTETVSWLVLSMGFCNCGAGGSISASAHDRALSCYSSAVGSWMGHLWRPVLLPCTLGKQESRMTWAHRLYNILHSVPERGGLPGRRSPVLPVSCRLEFSGWRATCTCQAGAGWAIGPRPIKKVGHCPGRLPTVILSSMSVYPSSPRVACESLPGGACTKANFPP